MVKKILNKLKRLNYKQAIAPESIEKRFSNIYSKNLWFKNGQSRSGSGSTLEATEEVRKWLPDLLVRLDARNLIDLGCGDFYWMKEVKLPCKYIGLDIVPEIIELNRAKYQDEQHLFHKHNAVDEKLPVESDVILCREVLFHLSFEDGLKMIDRILTSNARYLIITTSEKVIENQDIKTGEFRNLNVSLPPFNFPETQDIIQDSKSVTYDRFLGVWSLDDLRMVFNN